MLKQGDPVVAPGIYDCLTARLVESAGFEVALVSGAAVAASVLGVPDLGLISMAEVLTQTRNIARCVSIPVIADCDNGYGNPINVRRTVQEFESAGVAGLFIEDQISPKRCGHFDGKDIVDETEMVAKISAACDARQDSDLLIVARTDAIAVGGVEDAIRRGHAYRAAGADVLFIEAPRSVEEIRRVGDEFRTAGTPLMINMVEGGRSPLLSVAELATLGYRLISFSGSLQKAALHSMAELLGDLRSSGSVVSFYPRRMASLDQRSALLGLAEYTELEQRYRTS